MAGAPGIPQSAIRGTLAHLAVPISLSQADGPAWRFRGAVSAVAELCDGILGGHSGEGFCDRSIEYFQQLSLGSGKAGARAQGHRLCP